MARAYLGQRKLRTEILGTKWSDKKYLGALQRVEEAAEAVVSPWPSKHSLAVLVYRLQQALDNVPVCVKEAAEKS